jgi:hypothetical protein
MTQEEKQLLLQDLCARLPYGVMLNIDYYDLQGDGKLKNRDVILSYGNIGYCSDNTNWVSVKPYLRPMSSMTEEEEDEWWEFDNKNTIVETHSYSIDWLNAHHFDYRGLIPKGLAIEAPKEMYDYD